MAEGEDPWFLYNGSHRAHALMRRRITPAAACQNLGRNSATPKKTQASIVVDDESLEKLVYARKNSVLVTVPPTAATAAAAVAATAATVTSAATATAVATTATAAAATAATITSAPTATATVAAAAVAPATAAAAATATVTAAAATATFLTRAGFVDGQRTAVDVLAVDLADGIGGILLGRHGDKGKTAGLARDAVLHEKHFRHGADRAEEVL